MRSNETCWTTIFLSTYLSTKALHLMLYWNWKLITEGRQVRDSTRKKKKVHKVKLQMIYRGKKMIWYHKKRCSFLSGLSSSVFWLCVKKQNNFSSSPKWEKHIWQKHMPACANFNSISWAPGGLSHWIGSGIKNLALINSLLFQKLFNVCNRFELQRWPSFIQISLADGCCCGGFHLWTKSH